VLTSARASRRVAAVLFAAAALACSGDGLPDWREEDGYRWRELEVHGGESGYVPVDPERAGIAYRNEMDADLIVENEILANGSGVALGDVDGDGRPDVFLPGIAGASALYRNLGDWRFEDVTAAAGLDLAGRPARGAAFADVDGDADLDLLVTLHAEPDRLYLNDGAGRFTRAREAGFETARAGHTLALADTDADGDLDLYVTNYKDRWARDLFPPSELTFERLFEAVRDSFVVRDAYREHFRAERTGAGWRRRELAQPDGPTGPPR